MPNLDDFSNTNPDIDVSPATKVSPPLRSPVVRQPKPLDQPGSGDSAGRRTLDQPGTRWPRTLAELRARGDR